MPFRDIAVILGSIAHWIFTVKYVNLALFMPMIMNAQSMSQEKLKLERKQLEVGMVVINTVFYALLFWTTVKQYQIDFGNSE